MDLTGNAKLQDSIDRSEMTNAITIEEGGRVNSDDSLMQTNGRVAINIGNGSALEYGNIRVEGEMTIIVGDSNAAKDIITRIAKKYQ